MKLLRNKRKYAKKDIKKSSLLKKLIITSLKGAFMDKTIKERAFLKKRIKRATLQLARRDEGGTAGDLMTQLLKKFEASKTEEHKKVEKELIKFAMKSKVYEFGTGRTSLVTKNKFIAALNEFSKFYEHLIETDLVDKQKSGEFDYLSLINLLKMYLNKVMKKFSGWSSKDQSTLDLIIERTKKAFFSYKLNKKFISSKKHYMQINVFERLNTMETFSLKRLF
jgi:hypothetical protein